MKPDKVKILDNFVNKFEISSVWYEICAVVERAEQYSVE